MGNQGMISLLSKYCKMMTRISSVMPPLLEEKVMLSIFLPLNVHAGPFPGPTFFIWIISPCSFLTGCFYINAMCPFKIGRWLFWLKNDNITHWLSTSSKEWKDCQASFEVDDTLASNVSILLLIGVASCLICKQYIVWTGEHCVIFLPYKVHPQPFLLHSFIVTVTRCH